MRHLFHVKFVNEHTFGEATIEGLVTTDFNLTIIQVRREDLRTLSYYTLRYNIFI